MYAEWSDATQSYVAFSSYPPHNTTIGTISYDFANTTLASVSS